MQFIYTYKNGKASGISFGDHLCSIYQNKVQQFSQIVPFIIEGLQANQKCIYIPDENSLQEIILQFKQFEIDLDPYLASKQFEIISKESIYMEGGVFDQNKVEGKLRTLVQSALQSGYTGVRGAAEMGWTASLPNKNKLLEYESRLSKLFQELSFVAICQYSEIQFSKEYLINMLREHPFIIIYGKLYPNTHFYSFPDRRKKEDALLLATPYETIINTIIEE